MYVSLLLVGFVYIYTLLILFSTDGIWDLTFTKFHGLKRSAHKNVGCIAQNKIYFSKFSF